MYTIRPCVKIIGMSEAAQLNEFYIFLDKNILTRPSICMKDNREKINGVLLNI